MDNTTEAIPHRPSVADRLAPLLPTLRRALLPVAVLAAIAGGAAWLNQQRLDIPAGMLAVRGDTVIRDGQAWALPGLGQPRLLPARDLNLQMQQLQRADSAQALQTVEGLSVGLEIRLRIALDERRLPELARKLPAKFETELVEPALASLLYPLVAQHTVRELFSTQRQALQTKLEQQLRERLAADGLILKSLSFGAVNLPAEYRKGLEGLLAEGLAADKMRFTLDLREKQGKEQLLAAQADRASREVAAEAEARERIIAARAQEEAMKHVLPFKQRQIEQRQLEAEAERQARVKIAEGQAQARRIEAEGEAAARQKLADAEAYRAAALGKEQAAQMAREGELISKHPLLVQKTLVDKLGDKVRVIVAPTGTNGQLLAKVAGGEVQE
jgi:regulator of protease activity HflC (stomatin/prohibitin superfamily)